MRIWICIEPIQQYLFDTEGSDLFYVIYFSFFFYHNYNKVFICLIQDKSIEYVILMRRFSLTQFSHVVHAPSKQKNLFIRNAEWHWSHRVVILVCIVIWSLTHILRHSFSKSKSCLLKRMVDIVSYCSTRTLLTTL